MEEEREKRLIELIADLKVFISKEDHMISRANKIEVALDELFPEDDYAQNLVSDLAQYSPGGGDYLYSYEDILPIAKSALKWLETK